LAALAPREWVLMVSGFGLVATLAIATSLSTYLQTGWAAGMQGRYLLPTIPGVALAAAVGMRREVRGWRIGFVALSAIAVSIHVASLGLLLHAWWGTREGGWSVSDGLSSWGSWLPWPPEVVFLIVAIAAISIVAALRTSPYHQVGREFE
jgi:hypothetical protein